ncbi:hypothetical protein QBC44DRAFT_321550 [Cladorrhinum sp. PSN332]|nr:hypothetical protein QBC44DRAFT_321550 [Cladorrhinum sp. PSN332]
MDLPVDWSQEVIKNALPPGILNFLNVHVLDPSSPFQSVLRQTTVFLSAALARVLPLLGPLIDYTTNLIGENPNIFSGVIIVLVAYLCIEVISFAKRVMLFWTRLAMRLLLWGWIALLVSVLAQRGFAKSLSEAGAWAGTVFGMVSRAVEVWVGEYQLARAEQERAQQAAMGGGGTGYGRARGY